MSIKIMSKVWESDMDSSRKLIMLAMADFADDAGGGIWPSIPTLAKKCSMSERTLQDHLAKMRGDGWLLIDGAKPVRGGYVNVYRINLSAKWCEICTGAKSAPVQKTSESGAKSAPNPYDPSGERETGETQHEQKSPDSLSAKRVAFNECDIPSHLKNQKSPPRKRKLFKAGAWKGYDPNPASRAEAVKLYRRAFPYIKLDRDEVKTIAGTYRDIERFQAVLRYWKKGVDGPKRWSARNWRGIREQYDRLAFAGVSNASDVVNPDAKVGKGKQIVNYEPVYN